MHAIASKFDIVAAAVSHTHTHNLTPPSPSLVRLARGIRRRHRRLCINYYIKTSSVRIRNLPFFNFAEREKFTRRWPHLVWRCRCRDPRREPHYAAADDNNNNNQMDILSRRGSTIGNQKVTEERTKDPPSTFARKFRCRLRRPSSECSCRHAHLFRQE